MIRRPLDFRFPEREQSYTQGGTHETVNRTWTTGCNITDKRGTMYLRFTAQYGCNAHSMLRVTIDGVAYSITAIQKYMGLDAWWIFDFNESVLIEHYITAYVYSRIEYGYYEYRP